MKDGNYGMPYLPEKIYADMRRFSVFRDQLTEDRIRNINRVHRELKIYFPEYMDAFGKVDGASNGEQPKPVASQGVAGVVGSRHCTEMVSGSIWKVTSQKVIILYTKPDQT